MSDNRGKSTKNHLAFLFALGYIAIGMLWVMYHHTDWIFLFATICMLILLSYGQFRGTKRAKQAATIANEHERSKLEDRIRHMAFYDDFTGLPNRRLFYDELTKALDKVKINGEALAVMLIDIDRFKFVNESFGHDFGDILLMQIAERLTRHVGKGDFVARMEGDEFALFYSDVDGKEATTDIAHRIMEEIEPVFLIQDFQLHVTISIGISLSNNDEDANMLMKNANMALSKAKELGRDNYQFYAPTMNMRSYERLTLEHDLRRAIEADEFIIHYQPQIDTLTGEIVGAEALIRWEHPTKGLIMPADFIPIAEDNGMIVAIGDKVLHKVCMQNKQWQLQGYPHFPVSVNLSIRQFMRQDLPGRISDILESSGLEAQYLELEITESMTMDVEHAINSLHELRALGVGISIDDFGTGYSSLSYLKKFPINRLKIDRSFVRDIMNDPNDASIVSTIIAMARGFDLKVIAEGVETEEQLSYLQKYGCNEVQGYLFSPPVGADKLVEQMVS